MTLPMLGYVRVSRVGARTKEDGFVSPDLQEAAIRKWALANDATVEMMPHEMNVSGGTMDRPVFNDCMDRIRRGEAAGIVVYKSDRFARTLLGAVATLGELGKFDAAFASASEPTLDYYSTNGRLFMHMLFAFAEFLRSSLKDSWRVSTLNAVNEKGIHVAPYGAFGYDKGDDKRFTPNDMAEFVKRAFELRADENYTWNGIADWLNEQAPLEDKDWTGQAVQRMVSRRVYRGEAFYGIVSNTENQPSAINRNAHPPLVDEDLWTRAQMDPSIARGGPLKGQQESKALLGGGLIRCAGCRYTMTLGYANSNGAKYPIYRCRGRSSGGKCPAPSNISAERLEAYARAHVAELLTGLETQGTPDSGEAVARAQEALDEAKEVLDIFKANRRAIKDLGVDAWNELLQEYVGDVKKSERALGDAMGQQGAGLHTVTVDEFLAAPMEEQRRHIHAAIDYIVVRRLPGRGRNAASVAERSLILWRGDGPDDFPRKRVYSGPIKSFDWPSDEPEARMLAA